MHINFIPDSFINSVKKIKKRQKRFITVSKIFAGLGVVFLFLSFAPSVWYSLATRVDDYSMALFATAKKGQDENIQRSIPQEDWQPPQDPKLPLEPTLIIPSIKVATTINEANFDNYEKALKKGVWRVPDFGTPFDRKKPTILAAHRFGYLAWSNLYRRFNSFYNLPKLNIGDTVEIIYRQKKYVYEVYAEGRGESIEDYKADLILYTCETLNSKIRIFKYARLLKI